MWRRSKKQKSEDQCKDSRVVKYLLHLLLRGNFIGFSEKYLFKINDQFCTSNKFISVQR